MVTSEPNCRLKLPVAPVQLMIEEVQAFATRINGTVIDTDSAIEGWIDRCFSMLPIPAESLKEGENVVDIRTDYHEASNLEALYLAGDFGVSISGKKCSIVASPARVAASDISGQGLPFYSGAIRYTLKVERKPTEGERIFLTVPEFEGACLKVVANGNTQIIGWQPYEADITDALAETDEIALELVLTRRNRFGPLHQLPVRAPNYGPNNWFTEGEGWSDEYQLWPVGLLAAPVVEVRIT